MWSGITKQKKKRKCAAKEAVSGQSPHVLPPVSREKEWERGGGGVDDLRSDVSS